MPRKATQSADPFAALSPNSILTPPMPFDSIARLRARPASLRKADPVPYVKSASSMPIDLSGNSWRPMPLAAPSGARYVQDPDTGYTVVQYGEQPTKYFDPNHMQRSFREYHQAKTVALSRQLAQDKAAHSGLAGIFAYKRYLDDATDQRSDEIRQNFINLGHGIVDTGKLISQGLIDSNDGMTATFGPTPESKNQAIDRIQQSNEKGAIQGQAMVQQLYKSPTGTLIRAGFNYADGRHERALKLLKTVPGQIWDDAQRDPVQASLNIMAAFGFAGGVLGKGASMAGKLAEVTDAIDVASASGKIDGALASKLKANVVTAARKAQQRLATSANQANYYGSGGPVVANATKVLGAVKNPLVKFTQKSSGTPAPADIPTNVSPTPQQEALPSPISDSANKQSRFQNDMHIVNTYNAATSNFHTVTPSEYMSQFQNNTSKGSLTPYTHDELTQMERYKLRDADIYYALKDIQEHEITGNKERDIVGVMNNDVNANGLATPAVMLHAIENGATTLDAWDVHGFLPLRYSRFGFNEIARQPYDISYGLPSEELKSAWKNSGWVEGNQYPDVVYMKYGGDSHGKLAPDRGRVRENYLKTGTIYGTGTPGVPVGETGRIHLGDEGPDTALRSGSVRSGEGYVTSGSGGSNTPRSDGVLNIDTFTQLYRQLHQLTGDDLERVGLRQSDINRLTKPEDPTVDPLSLYQPSIATSTSPASKGASSVSGLMDMNSLLARPLSSVNRAVRNGVIAVAALPKIAPSPSNGSPPSSKTSTVDPWAIISLARKLGVANPLQSEANAFYNAGTPRQRNAAATILRQRAAGMGPLYERMTQFSR